MQHAVAGDLARGGHHDQRMPVVRLRQEIPRRDECALLLCAGGVGACQRYPGGIEPIGQRHRRTIDARTRQLGRRIPVVVGAGLVGFHHDRLGHRVFRYAVGREADRVDSTQRAQGAPRTRIAVQRLHETRIGIRLDEYVVGQSAAADKRPHVGPAVGVGRVLSHDPGHHGRDEHRRHETGHDRYRGCRQRADQPPFAGAAGREVQPGRIAGGDRKQGEKDCADCDPVDLRHRAVERHTVAGDIPPAVGGGPTQRQQEE